MITITVHPPVHWHRRTTVEITNQDDNTKSFEFAETDNAQLFLEHLCTLLPFIGIEYRVLDGR